MKYKLDKYFIIVIYQCCECKAKSKYLLDEPLPGTAVCDECNIMENYIEPIGVIIRKRK